MKFNLFKNGLTALFVLFFFLILFSLKSLDYFNPLTASLIINRYQWPNYSKIKNSQILAGQKLTAKFKANNDRLGIVAVAFNTDFQKLNFDTLIFRIKAEGDESWYYLNTYTNIKNSHDFIPFGFPIIENSQGKTFEFEIESVSGQPENALSLSYRYPFFFTKSSFPIEYLKQHHSTITSFLYGKFNSVINLMATVPLINYLYILAFCFFFNLFLALKTTRPPIPLSFFIDSSLLALGLALAYFLTYQSEAVEWRLYTSSAISLVVLTPLIQAFFTKKRPVPLKFLTLVFGIILLLLLLTQSLAVKEIMALGIIAIFLLKTHFFGLVILFNLTASLSVLGFFNLNFPDYSWWTILGVLAFSFCAFYCIPHFFRTFRFRFSFPRWLLILILLPIIFLLNQKRIDFHHYFLYLGPAFDLEKGKSLLSDTPSQFGYLSIYFVASMLKQIGFSLSRFHGLNTVVYITNAILGILVLFRLVKSKFLAFTASIIFISLQTIFTYYYQILYPSSGPLRFGLGLIIIFFFTYLPRQLSFYLSALIAAVAVFWSFEVGIFIVPAWIATLLTCHFMAAKSLKSFIRQVLPVLAFFGFCLIVLLSMIYLKEYHLQGQFPLIMPYVSNALTYTNYADGLGALPIPAFGNYYLLIFILILGLTTGVSVVIKRINSQYLPILVFISLHNLAIFSYFIGRSHENNIINIASYFLIELAVILVVLIKDLKVSRHDLYRWLALPAIIFLCLFSLRLVNQAKTVILFSKDNYQINRDLWLSPSISQSALSIVLAQLQLTDRPIVLLSPKNDTRLLVESNIENSLPLNPAQMTFYLGSGWLNQYVYPAISKLRVGTVVVVDQAVSGSFLEPALFAIHQNYHLEKIGSVPTENLEIYIITQ